MTEIVTAFVPKHHFQYVERRYSGFVALSSVVGVCTSAWTILGINGLKRCKNSAQLRRTAKPKHSNSKYGRLIKLGLPWKPLIPTP
jgi:hypothetical protein